MTTFFMLPRKDVVFSVIFPRLDPVELWRLRLVCREFCRLCEEYFATFCSSLAYEELTACESEVLRDRACLLRALNTCKRLRRVSLRLSRRHKASEPLERASKLLMTAIWKLHTDSQLTSLTLVSLESCEDPHTGWETLGQICGALTELHIEDVSQFDDKCLESLTVNCGCLVSLTLKSLAGVRGQYLPILAGNSSQLTSLNLSGCLNISVESLQRTVRSCENVRIIDFSSLFGAVDDGTILAVKEFCPHLRRLCVTHCPRVTQRYLVPLKDRGVHVTGINTETNYHKYHKIWGQI